VKGRRSHRPVIKNANKFSEIEKEKRDRNQRKREKKGRRKRGGERGRMRLIEIAT
jgi:hypothetical protein